MSSKKPNNSTHSGEGSKNVSKDSSKDLKSGQRGAANAWGAPGKRIVQSDTAITSPKKQDVPQRSLSNDKEKSKECEGEYEDDYDYDYEEDHDNRDQDEDVDSECEWSGAEYEDKIPSGAKVKMVRARLHFSKRNESFKADINGISVHPGDSALQAKKPKKE